MIPMLPGFKKQDLIRGVGGQAISEDTACRTSADDYIIIAVHWDT